MKKFAVLVALLAVAIAGPAWAQTLAQKAVREAELLAPGEFAYQPGSEEVLAWIYEVLYDKHLDLTLVPEARGDLIVIKVQRTPYSFSQADLPGLLRITRMVAGSPTSATAIAATGTTVNATKVRAVVRLPQALDYYQRVVFAKFAYYRQLVQGLERTATEFRMTPREVKELAVAWFLDIFVKLPPPVPARFLVLPPERRR